MIAGSLLGNDHEGRADVSACKVLVVDDSASFRKIIGAFLRSAGIVTLEFADNGRDGLEKVASFEPDLVILDIMMPEMDGFEVCRRLRADPKHHRLPVLVQTALEDPAERTAVFQAGASDLITKPIHGPELIARVRVQLENRLLIGSLEDYRHRVETELNLARKMQEALLPDLSGAAEIGQCAGLLVDSHFRPSAEIGGDMWTIRNLGDGKIAVSTVDFSGHGVSAALNTFRLHTLMHQSLPHEDEPAAYLGLLNEQLVDLLPTHQFATMFYGVIDTRAGHLTYAGAGAPSPILSSADGPVALNASGLPLGITRAATYKNRSADFPEGAFLLLYSDALVETADHDGKTLETEDLLSWVSDALTKRGMASPLGALLDRFRTNHKPPDDDLTLVWLESRHS